MILSSRYLKLSIGLLITDCLLSMAACDPGYEIKFVNTTADTLMVSYNIDSIAAMHKTDTATIRTMVFAFDPPFKVENSYYTHRVLPAKEIIYRAGTGSGFLPVSAKGSKAFYVFNPRTSDTLFFDDEKLIRPRVTVRKATFTKVDIGIPKQ